MGNNLVLEGTDIKEEAKDCLEFPVANGRYNRSAAPAPVRVMPVVRGELLRFEPHNIAEAGILTRELKATSAARLVDFNARAAGRFSRLAVEAVRERARKRQLEQQLDDMRLKLAAAENRAAKAEAELAGLGEFECSVAILTHDIASPLTGLVGFLQLVIDMVNDDYAKEDYSVLLHDAEEAAWRMRRLLVRMQSLTEPHYKRHREQLGEQELADLRRLLHSSTR